MKTNALILSLALAASSAAFAVTDEDVRAVTELLSIPSVTKDVAANDRAIDWMRHYLESHGVWCKTETMKE